MSIPLKVWLQATRPKTLGAAVAPVLIGSAMALRDDFFSPGPAAAALLGAMLIQIGTNLANDYYDFIKGADDEHRVGPVRVTQAGLIPPQTVRWAFVAVFAAATAVGSYLAWIGGLPIVIIGVLSILSGILYTGGPWPLGYLGLGDLFVLIFFGPIAVGGTYYVQSLALTPAVIWAGVATGLISTALLAVNNLRDVETDTRAGKRTLAVRLGSGFARGEYVVCLVGASVIPVGLAVAGMGPWAACVATSLLVLAIPAIRQVLTARGAVLNETLGHTGKLLVIYSVLFSLGWSLG